RTGRGAVAICARCAFEYVGRRHARRDVVPPTRPIGPTGRIIGGLSLFDSGSLAYVAVRQVVVDGVQGRLCTVMQSSLGENRRNVILDRSFGERKRFCDLAVAG